MLHYWPGYCRLVDGGWYLYSLSSTTEVWEEEHQNRIANTLFRYTMEQYIRFRVLFVHRNLLLDEEEEDSTSISVFLVNECRCQIICHHHPIAIAGVDARVKHGGVAK